MVTGQQVGLFGGPLFSIFKALTAVKLADQATRSGVDCVPVFWLATEDHDLAEVNQVLDSWIRWLFAEADGAHPGRAGCARGNDTVRCRDSGRGGSRHGVAGSSAEVSDFLREAYRPGESFGTAFARLFARLFADWGVILLDAADPEFHQIATPIYQAAIERAAELDEALLARGKALEAAGYHQQVKVTPSSTLLFACEMAPACRCIVGSTETAVLNF